MIRLFIIADDFTGGLDTGVQFASRGIPACVLTDPDADWNEATDGYEVLVAVAETRHLPPREAYDKVYAVARRAVEAGIGHIYKKTDSALRGNIGAELSAVAHACEVPLLPFIPALPAMNRITRNGIQFIDGVPVAESVFGRDPFEPVRESDVVKLIALQSDMPVVNAGAERLRECSGIAVIDAESDADLLRVERCLEQAEGLRASAGCAGFATVLPELLRLEQHSAPAFQALDPGLFVLCGSVNPITQRQLDYGEANGYTRVHIPPEIKLYPERLKEGEGQAVLSGWKRQMESTTWMILDANDADPGNRETAGCAAGAGMNTEEVRQRISESLGIILSSLADSSARRTLLITGGDTLLTGMNLLGVNRMVPLTEVFPGVVLSRVTLCGRPRYVITKSGGFGKETLLSDLKERIEKQPEA